MSTMTEVEKQGSRTGSPLGGLRIFAKLGVTCFGGPIAHIAYFRDEFVVRRKWVENATGTDLLRVMISKSLNFTFSVTVRPRDPLSSQCRQTLSINGCSSAAMASNSVRSLANVFSAPTDFRIRFARTSRLSTPREIQ